MNKIAFNKTKIIATIGPACSSFENLKKLADAGMDVCRLNFSHGEHKTFGEIISSIHKLNQDKEYNIAILCDLQGPKLRVGNMPEEGVRLESGKKIIITNNEITGTTDKFTLRYPLLSEDLKKDTKILLDDGKMEVKILSVLNKNEVSAEIIRGGILKSKKGFNLPGAQISLPALTDKDKKDLEYILEQDIDWIALSFVRKAEDVLDLKQRIADKAKNISVISKIEKPEAVKNINSIIEASDGIMIARGDLGIEMPLQEVPIIQKNIIEKCIAVSKPAIVATQMMESMMNNTIPSRAEVSDVANAVIDGADAVMLSGETSVGKYPSLTVATMDKIINDVELDIRPYFRGSRPKKKSKNFIADEICYTASKISAQMKVKGIVIMTQSGSSAQKIASFRPKSNLFIFSENKKLIRKLALIWGIRCFYYSKYQSTDQTISDTNDILEQNEHISKGDIVIHTASMPIEKHGRANTLKISII